MLYLPLGRGPWVMIRHKGQMGHKIGGVGEQNYGGGVIVVCPIFFYVTLGL